MQTIGGIGQRSSVVFSPTESYVFAVDYRSGRAH
jgi:hypothetical protein